MQCMTVQNCDAIHGLILATRLITGTTCTTEENFLLTAKRVCKHAWHIAGVDQGIK